jgi:ADP-ribose pyrophosphatase YjhB (NUDIX family)
MQKTPENPLLTVDAIIEIEDGIILIKRKNPPPGWAIPGGFVDYGESLEEAVEREALEETGLSVKNLTQMHTYSDPCRDPRFHTVTTVFIGRAKGKPKAGSDAQKAKVFKPHEWEKIELAFDHRKVLSDYLQYKKCPHTLLSK